MPPVRRELHVQQRAARLEVVHLGGALDDGRGPAAVGALHGADAFAQRAARPGGRRASRR